MRKRCGELIGLPLDGLVAGVGVGVGVHDEVAKFVGSVEPGAVAHVLIGPERDDRAVVEVDAEGVYLPDADAEPYDDGAIDFE